MGESCASGMTSGSQRATLGWDTAVGSSAMTDTELQRVLARRKRLLEEGHFVPKTTHRRSSGNKVDGIRLMFETGMGLNADENEQENQDLTPIAAIPLPVFPPPETPKSFLYKSDIISGSFYDIPKMTATPVKLRISPPLDESSTLSHKPTRSASPLKFKTNPAFNNSNKSSTLSVKLATISKNPIRFRTGHHGSNNLEKSSTLSPRSTTLSASSIKPRPDPPAFEDFEKSSILSPESTTTATSVSPVQLRTDLPASNSLDRSSTLSSKKSSNSSTASSAQSSFLWSHLNKMNNRTSQLSDSSGIVEDRDCTSISSAEEADGDEVYECIEEMNLYENCDKEQDHYENCDPEEDCIYEDVSDKEDECIYENVSDRENDDEFGEVTRKRNDNTPEVGVVNDQWLDPARTIANDTGTSSTLEKCTRVLKERVRELVDTETVFVEKLRHVVRDYMIQMEQPETPQHIRDIKEDIFSNIGKIYRFHSRELLPAIKQSRDDLKRIGKTFVDYKETFLLYVEYARNSTKANTLFVLNRDYFKEQERKFGDKLDLSSYLLEPIQRLPRYKLFLDELVKTYSIYEDQLKTGGSIHNSINSGSCRNSIASYSGSTASTSSEDTVTTLDNLQSAKQVIDKLLRKVDNTIALENIRDCQIDLSEQGELLRQDEFAVTDQYKNTIQMRCFLFEKILVFTYIEKKPPTELFLYRDAIAMTDLGLTPNSSDSDLGFWVWQRVRTVKPYRIVVNELSTKVRDAWVSQISNLLREQAQRIKDQIQEDLRRKKIIRSPIPIVQKIEDDYKKCDVVQSDSNHRASVCSTSSVEYCEIQQPISQSNNPVPADKSGPGEKFMSNSTKRKKRKSKIREFIGLKKK